MEKLTSSYAGQYVKINVGLQFHEIIDYDRKVLRRALVKGAAEIRREARRLVARKAISEPGAFPGTDTGQLKRAIGVVSKAPNGGGWIKVGVKKTPKMNAFYPAFLFYGVKKQGKIERLAAGEGLGKSNRRARGERAALIAERRTSDKYFVAPRGNYIQAALMSKRDAVKDLIQTALRDALVPR